MSLNSKQRMSIDSCIRALEQCNNTTNNDVIFKNCNAVRNWLTEIMDGLFAGRRHKEMDKEE